MITTNQKTKPVPKELPRSRAQNNEARLASFADEPDAKAPTIEEALHSALHHFQSASERWRPLILNGATDAELTAAIGKEFGISGSASIHGGYHHKGGTRPEFSWLKGGATAPTPLKGKRLLAKVREVMGIGAPGQSVHDDIHVAAGKAVEAIHQSKQDADAAWEEDFKDHPGFDHPAPALNGHPQLQMIPLDRIVPSPTNPRKYFDPVKLRELAGSIIEHGLAQPILVRPTTLDPIPGGEYDSEPFNTQYYEIIAGERRWRAAGLADLKEIEAKIRDLDDRAALEIQFIENLQRTDLSPIEEADGYKRLLDQHGYTAESLAGKLSKSKSYVYGRLKLCNLPAPAMDALAKGDLPATVGELIGRLPSMEMREKFWDDSFEDYGKEYFEMPSFREAKHRIEDEYMRELKSAPWNKNDAKLVPEVGACKTCLKMTGNNRAEYPDARADMCTDTGCFDRKLKAHFDRQVEKAEKGGARVLTDKQTAKMFNTTGESSWLTHEAQRESAELRDDRDRQRAALSPEKQSAIDRGLEKVGEMEGITT